MKHYFIAATDTDAGKTFVACAIIQALINKGKKVAAYKPVSAGCQLERQMLINEDAQLLSQFANCQQSISEVNPIAFVEAIAPHIAAAKVNRTISIKDIVQGYEQVKATGADISITEGAGGWRLPIATNSINNNIFLSDFVKASQQTVILVVNMKLGCLNHALLSYEAIKADGLDCIAWIANTASSETMTNLAENISSLEKLLPIPKIAQLGYFNDDSMSLSDKINLAAKQINVSLLLDTKEVIK